MDDYKHRQLLTKSFMGEDVQFIASNARLQERVDALSHEQDVLETLVRVTDPDDVFWDVGACLGIHTFVLARHLPHGRVVGFEPMPVNRGVLMDNKAVNQLENVHIEPLALGESDEDVEFALRESVDAGYGRHGISTGEYDAVERITVPKRRGDALVDESLPLPNVVKIDVEGAGPLVLEGMESVLTHDACTDVVLETHEPNPVQPSHEDFGYSRDDIIQLLEDYGFSVTTLTNDWHLHATKRTKQPVDSTALDISVEQGDIAAFSADAIVNSAGTSLRMGTGVAGALREAGGEELNRAAVQQWPASVGDAIVTDAFSLDADIVVHAVSMPHHGNGRSTVESVRRAVRNSLAAADDRGCTSIVLPAVGCGLGGLPLATGAAVILDELRAYEPTSLESATFVAYTDDELETVQRVQ